MWNTIQYDYTSVDDQQHAVWSQCRLFIIVVVAPIIIIIIIIIIINVKIIVTLLLLHYGP